MTEPVTSKTLTEVAALLGWLPDKNSPWLRPVVPAFSDVYVDANPESDFEF
jgi:hypothetical protein